MIRNKEFLDTLHKFISDNSDREYDPYLYETVPNFDTIVECDGIYFYYYKVTSFLKGIESQSIVYKDRHYDEDDNLISKNLELSLYSNDIVTPITLEELEKEFNTVGVFIFSDIRDAADHFCKLYCDPNRFENQELTEFEKTIKNITLEDLQKYSTPLIDIEDAIK